MAVAYPACTEFAKETFENGLDLEALARHRVTTFAPFKILVCGGIIGTFVLQLIEVRILLLRLALFRNSESA